MDLGKLATGRLVLFLTLIGAGVGVILLAPSPRQDAGRPLAAGEKVEPEALVGSWQVKNKQVGAFGCPADYDPAPPEKFSLEMEEMPEMEGMPQQFFAFFGARYEMSAKNLIGEASLLDWSKLPKAPPGAKAPQGGPSGSGRTPIEEASEPDEECPYAEKMGRTMAKYSKFMKPSGQVFMGNMEPEETKEGEMELTYSYFGKPSPLPSLKGLLMIVDRGEEKCPCTYVYEWEAKPTKK